MESLPWASLRKERTKYGREEKKKNWKSLEGDERNQCKKLNELLFEVMKLSLFIEILMLGFEIRKIGNLGKIHLWQQALDWFVALHNNTMEKLGVELGEEEDALGDGFVYIWLPNKCGWLPFRFFFYEVMKKC